LIRGCETSRKCMCVGMLDWVGYHHSERSSSGIYQSGNHQDHYMDSKSPCNIRTSFKQTRPRKCLTLLHHVRRYEPDLAGCARAKRVAVPELLEMCACISW
jgi:hypothetical protein